MVSQRTMHVGIGSALTFFISLGTAIPAFGLFLGPLFTFGGGFVGAAAAGWLRGQGVQEGVKTGLLVALVGGITSSLVAVTGGTLLNVVFVSQESSGDTLGGWLLIAGFGFVSGLVFTLIGAIFGGALGAGLKDAAS